MSLSRDEIKKMLIYACINALFSVAIAMIVVYAHASMIGANLDLLPNDTLHKNLTYDYMGYPINVNLYICNNGEKLAYIDEVRLYLIYNNREFLLDHGQGIYKYWTFSIPALVVKPGDYMKFRTTIFLNNIEQYDVRLSKYIEKSKIIRFRLEIFYYKNSIWREFGTITRGIVVFNRLYAPSQTP